MKISEKDNKPKPCPRCTTLIEKPINTARVIYGYTDDGDRELNERDGKDLYLAGCVPDSYGADVIIGGVHTWVFPMNYCNVCENFFNYAEENVALSQEP